MSPDKPILASRQSVMPILCTGGMFAVVTALAAGFVMVQTRLTLDDPVHLPDWPFRFRVPAGWEDEGDITDFLGSRVRVYSEPNGRLVLRVRRFALPADASADTAFRAIIAQYDSFPGVDFTDPGQPQQTRLGQWPATTGQVAARLAGAGRFGIHLSLIAAVGRTSGTQADAFSVELQADYPLEHRDRFVWRAVLGSIVPVGDEP